MSLMKTRPNLLLWLLLGVAAFTASFLLAAHWPATSFAQVKFPPDKPAPKPKPKPAPAPRRPAATPRQKPQPVEIEMVALPGGTFTMGSNNGREDEKPPHQVALSPFSIGKYEVTQAQYRAVIGTNPSKFKGDDRPVEQVSWDDAVNFCRKLSQQSGKTYRLPTEAEWEYACRAGSSGDYAGNLDEMAWYDKNSSNQTHSVGQKKPNAFGLFDMHGNVWEWCQDLYDANYYKQSLGKDPQGPSSGTNRVLRGGSWIDFNYNCRSAYRNYSVPDARININGFRVVAGERTQ